MSKFFERGNLALDWDYIKGDFVAVDGDGYAVSYAVKPLQSNYDEWLPETNEMALVGRVGAPCPDWRELLFERPKAPHLPDGFWEAVDIVFGPGYE
jgi:hypothetical protein